MLAVNGSLDMSQDAGSSRQEPGQALWWWAGSEAEARRRFRERFGYEPTVIAIPQPGIVALGPVKSV